MGSTEQGKGNAMFAEVNHLEEGYVMDVTSGRTGDLEVQPQNINILEFQIEQQLLNFLQNQWINFTVKIIWIISMNCWKE